MSVRFVRYCVETISAKDISDFRGPSENIDNDLNLNILFNYLHPPSSPPSLSAKEATSDLNKIISTNAKGGQYYDPIELLMEIY